MSKLTCFLLFISLSIQAHDHMPEDGPHNNLGLKATVFKKLSHKSHKLKLKASFESSSAYTDQSYQQVLVGAYYLLPLMQKVGVFVSNEQGLRHENDWVIEDTKWLWEDTSKRSESVLHLVHSIKFRPSGFPLIYELQSNFMANSFNGHNMLTLKPSIHYFYMPKGIPLISLRAATPIYLALNYSDETLYKHGLYLGSMYHHDKNYTFGLSFEYLNETWTDSDDSKRLRSSQPYSATEVSQKILAEIIANY